MIVKDIPRDSWIVDPNTIINGAPVKWRLLDHDHKGYPSGSSTLIGLINKDNPYKVKPNGYWNDATKSTFLHFRTVMNGIISTVEDEIDFVKSQFSKGLSKSIIPTELDIGYSGDYASYGVRYRKEFHSVFLFGASEMNYGSSTSVNGPNTQKYFPWLSGFSNHGLAQYMTLGTYDRIMTRDIKISTSSYNTAYPSYTDVQRVNNVTSTAYELFLLPMINIDSNTVVAGQNEAGEYLLDLSEKRYLISKEGSVLHHDINPTSGEKEWITLPETVLTKDLFLTHGMTDLSAIPEEAWAELGTDFEILCFKEEAAPLQVKVTTETLYDEANQRYQGTGKAKVEEATLPTGVKQVLVQSMHENTAFTLVHEGVDLGVIEPGTPFEVPGEGKVELYAELTAGMLDAVSLAWM